MCNINIIIRRDKKRTTGVTECMNVVSFNSYLKNDDAEGYYCEDFKPKKAIHKQIIRGRHSLIVSHQRISTSGKNENMTQPIETDHFLVTHNGVFFGLGTVDDSDTYNYALKLEEKYAKNNSLIASLKELNKETDGRYSVAVYNKETREFIYYKCRGSFMYQAISKNYIMMSTIKDNVQYMVKYFNEEADISEVENTKFLDLNNNLEVIDTFEEYVSPPIKQIPYDYNRHHHKSNNRENSAVQQRNNIIELFNLAGFRFKTVAVMGNIALVGIYPVDEDAFLNYFSSAIIRKHKETKTLIEISVSEIDSELTKAQLEYSEETAMDLLQGRSNKKIIDYDDGFFD